MSRVVVLGAGMAGYGAVHRLHAEGLRPLQFDRLPYPGGHTASYEVGNGFIFDDGPHISFTKDPRIQELFAECVGGEFETIQARVNNLWRGHWIKHPAQCNLHGLPEELVVKILVEFVEAQHAEPGPIDNYADWLVAGFGRTFAETFPMRYGLKYHTTEAVNMSTDWLGQRLYRPDLAEVFRGALSPETPEVHYISHFRYPSHGGFFSYLKPFIDKAELKLGHDLVALDPSTRRLRFANGHVEAYDRVVSSIPLPALLPLIEGAPRDVVDAAGRLAWTRCVTVNLGVAREDISDCHWTYFYDDDFCFTRLSFPHMLSPNNTPPGTGAIQAELYYSDKYRPLDCEPESLIEPTIADLTRCGLLREDDEILTRNARLAPYGNVIFDLERADAVERVRGYLDDIGVATCGRYGEWGYHWTDESFKSGEDAAQKVLDSKA
ncbi:MAG: NAD(P)-binding protein [bacterium]|nr:NAD(P)-binding protein [bacterium]